MMNRLQHETSPYLLQHASNPVDWYPWCDEAFIKAAREGKPVLVSIGYAACHWCHVMEKESFENEVVARYMNQHFICIKVDREEYPEVDHFYMDALQAITGQGGWPLNMFVTPQRQPFYGGTYFPPKPMYGRLSWMQLLEQIQDAWLHRKVDINSQAEQLTNHLQHAYQSITYTSEKFNKESIDEMAAKLHHQADRQHGGFGKAPKFPSFLSLQFLLEHYHFTKNEDSLEITLTSLNKMLEGGIYDQIGGGISRYATDNKWLVPHFEKMLYDNALLINVLTDAYAITKNEKYKIAIAQTVNFCVHEMMSPEHLFYSAMDADSEGIEGKFYTWTIDEWNAALPNAHPAIKEYFGVSESGNWEGTNILHQAQEEDYILQKYHIEVSEWEQILELHTQQLLAARKKRIHPTIDDKILLSWNALMNTAITKAANLLDNDTYLNIAQKNMESLLEKFINQTDNSLYHTYKNSKAKIPATLDDYAYFTYALIQLSSVSGQLKYLSLAKKLTDEVITQFSNNNQEYFYYTSKSKTTVPIRKLVFDDNVMPSANAVMQNNLWVLGNLYEQTDYLERSDKMLSNIYPTASDYPLAYSYWALMLQRNVYVPKILVITGVEALPTLKKWNLNYLPNTFVIAHNSVDEDEIKILQHKPNKIETQFYLCQNGSCQLATQSIKEVIAQIKN